MDLTLLHNEPYEPNRGAWTYRIDVPDTRQLRAPGGSIKVTGTLDDIPFDKMNLMPLKNEDAMMSVNKQLREKLGKSGGNTVRVTMILKDADTLGF
jgi:hypothetical protein